MQQHPFLFHQSLSSSQFFEELIDDMNTRRCLKICCCTTVIVVLIVAITLVILYFAMLKPKDPQVVATPVNIQSIDFGLFPVVKLHLSLGMDINIKNKNYASFRYDNSTILVYYRGSLAAEAPIEAGTIKARSTQSVSTTVNIMGEKLAFNSFFMPDVFSGYLNLTSSSSLEGKVIILSMFKLPEKTSVVCGIRIFLRTRNSSSNCDSKIKIK